MIMNKIIIHTNEIKTRRKWKINPVTRIKNSDKIYNRKKERQKFFKLLKDKD
jgi:hypothetical protein